MMKKIAFLFIPYILTLGSCKKFLDTSPTGFVQVETYYQNEQELEAALGSVYATLTNSMNNSPGTGVYSGFLSIYAQGHSDEGYSNTPSGASAVGNNSFDYTNSAINVFWGTLYTGINLANNMLVAKINVSKSVKDSTVNALMGEAQFLRGYYYFLLVQHFGGVPLRLIPTSVSTNINTPRSSIADIYAQIIKDMKAAEPNLFQTGSPQIQGTNRITKTVADGILARVYLYMAGQPPVGLSDKQYYDSALVYATKVQSSTLHGLLTNADTMAYVKNVEGLPLAYPATHGSPAYSNNGYAQVFLNEAMAIYNPKETMWEVTYQPSVNFRMGDIGSQIGINCTDKTLGNAATYINTQLYLYNLYDLNDLRRDWNIAPYTFTGNIASRVFYAPTSKAGRCIGKFRREYEPITLWTPKLVWNTLCSFPLLRYSDVLLMLAEAELQVNGSTATALNAINQVIRRGHGLDINTPNPTVDLTNLTLKNIQDERAKELCFEALRTMDLKRWGIYLQTEQMILDYNIANGQPAPNRINLGALNALSAGSKILLWPIPSSEVLVNKAATQNSGW